VHKSCDRVETDCLPDPVGPFGLRVFYFERGYRKREFPRELDCPKARTETSSAEKSIPVSRAKSAGQYRQPCNGV
jgi:hypothetical protein